MVKTTYSIRQEQIAKMVQKELGTLLLTETASWNGLISVTAVQISSDLSLAKVYLSFSLHDEAEALLAKIDSHKNNIRRLLGKRVAGKMHKVPNLKFVIDDSVIQGARVTALIDQLDPTKG